VGGTGKQVARDRPKLDQAALDAGKTGSEVLSALAQAGEAIKQGYHRIRQDLG